MKAGISRELASKLVLERDAMTAKIESLRQRLNFSPERKRDSIAERVKRYEDRRLEIITFFVEMNIPLVRYIVSKYHFNHPKLDKLELMEKCEDSLVRCAERYNPSNSEAKFGTYAARALERACEKVNIKAHREKRDIDKISQLEEQIYDDEGFTIGDEYVDPQQKNPAGDPIYNDQVRIVGQILKTLGERERTILEYRFGFNGSEYSCEDLVPKFKVTRERIRQIQNAGLKKARDYLARRGITKIDEI